MATALAGSPPNRGSRKWLSSTQKIGGAPAPCKPKSFRGQALSGLWLGGKIDYF